MRSMNTMVAIAIATLMSSCYSTMNVRVDALNMPAFKATYLYNVENLNKKENSIRYLLSSDFTGWMNNLIGGLTAYIDTSGLYPNEDIKEAKKRALDQGRTIMNDITTKGNKALASIAAFRNKADDTTLAAYEKDIADFQVSLVRLAQFRQYINEIDESGEISLQGELEMDFQNMSEGVARAKSTFGEDILSDPMASVIAALPEQYWSKYHQNVNLSVNAGGIDQKKLGDISKYVTKEPNRYNNTFARTRMGNSDIAIRMASPGEFIVKGVRVDADEAVRNSFKVVSQGIKYLVYSAGMPVKDVGGSDKKTMAPLLDSLTQKTSDLQAAEQRYANATDAFLAVLADAQTDLNATAARPGLTVAQIKTNALERVKTAYAIYKAALSK